MPSVLLPLVKVKTKLSRALQKGCLITRTSETVESGPAVTLREILRSVPLGYEPLGILIESTSTNGAVAPILTGRQDVP